MPLDNSIIQIAVDKASVAVMWDADVPAPEVAFVIQLIWQMRHKLPQIVDCDYSREGRRDNLLGRGWVICPYADDFYRVGCEMGYAGQRVWLSIGFPCESAARNGDALQVDIYLLKDDADVSQAHIFQENDDIGPWKQVLGGDDSPVISYPGYFDNADDAIFTQNEASSYWHL